MIEEETKVWEPWVPQLGQRVRVRLNGECKAVFGVSDNPFLPTHGPWHPHPQEFEGAMGKVAWTFEVAEARDTYPPGYEGSPEELAAHRFVVDFGRSFDVILGDTLYRMGQGTFCAAELEPLED